MMCTSRNGVLYTYFRIDRYYNLGGINSDLIFEPSWGSMERSVDALSYRRLVGSERMLSISLEQPSLPLLVFRMIPQVTHGSSKRDSRMRCADR